MSKKNPFTEEQLHILEANPFTHSVTPNRIIFTVEFKKFFFDQVTNQGKTTRQALEAAGYDPNWFMLSHRDAIRKMVLREAASECGFKNPRGLTTAERIAIFEKKDLTEQRTKVSIRELQERIVHLEKQVELLKKKEIILKKYNQKD